MSSGDRMTKLISFGALAGLAVWAWPALAQSPYGYGGYGHGGFMHGGWGNAWHGMFLGPLMMLLFLAIATAVVVLIVRWIWGAGKGSHHGGQDTRALDILRERFARGDIDANEYEARRKILEG